MNGLKLYRSSELQKKKQPRYGYIKLTYKKKIMYILKTIQKGEFSRLQPQWKQSKRQGAYTYGNVCKIIRKDFLNNVWFSPANTSVLRCDIST